MNAAPAALAAAIADTRFIDNGDDTVTDTRTGLMWSKAPIGNLEDGETFADAEKLCGELALGGHSDWRLPNVHELFGLVDHSRHGPAIDVHAFPDTPSDWFWTSTPSAWAPSCAWCVDFNDGYVSGNLRSLDAFVRAVRSVPAGQ